MRIGKRAVLIAGAVAVTAGAWTMGQQGNPGSGQRNGTGAGTTTRPATRSTPADELLNQMLRPLDEARRPLVPSVQENLKDATSGRGAAAPDAPQMTLLREGTFIVDRTGRLVRSEEGIGLYEFAFDADGRVLRDPPVILLPNSRLERMEEMVDAEGRDVRFRITGLVTTYRGRNAVLVEKVVMVPKVLQQNIP